MPDEDKNFGGSLVLYFRKWWRHVKTIYKLGISMWKWVLASEFEGSTLSHNTIRNIGISGVGVNV